MLNRIPRDDRAIIVLALFCFAGGATCAANPDVQLECDQDEVVQELKRQTEILESLDECLCEDGETKR